MTIEIKVTGTDAAETVQQFLGLAGYIKWGTEPRDSTTVDTDIKPISIASAPAPVTVTVADDDGDEGGTLDYTTAKDQNGVGFNDAYFGKAAKPFYEGGKNSGQWKKRKGVSEADYDAYYAGELAKLRTAASGAPAAVEAPAPAPQVAPTNTVADAAPVVNMQAPAPQPSAPTPVQAPAPAPVAPQPAPQPAPALVAAPAAGKTHQDLQVTLSKTLGALMGKLPDGQNATEVLKSLLASYNVSGMPQIPADKIDECYDRMQRMITDPANAATIAVGLA